MRSRNLGLPICFSQSLNPCCNGIYSMRKTKTKKFKLRSLNPCCNGIYSMSTWFDTFSSASIAQVLILVVMEYTQWEIVYSLLTLMVVSLNPCCNGIYSMSPVIICGQETPQRLNPCCNGIYSMRALCMHWFGISRLNPCCNGIYSMRCTRNMAVTKLQCVLILVVMEYTQWVQDAVTKYNDLS